MEIKITNTFWHRVGDEKSIADIMNKFNSDNVLRNNNNLEVYEGEWVQVQVNDYISHFVRPMQTLTQIAEINSVDKEKLMKDNNLKTEKLYIGQRLKIYK